MSSIDNLDKFAAVCRKIATSCQTPNFYNSTTPQIQMLLYRYKLNARHVDPGETEEIASTGFYRLADCHNDQSTASGSSAIITLYS